MRKLLIVLSLLALTSCSTITRFEDAVTGSTVSPTGVYVAANTFDALEATATNYLRLPKCGSLPCRDASATKEIIPAIRSGRVARNNLRAFLAQHPGQLAPQGAYDALQASINTLKAVFANYDIGG